MTIPVTIPLDLRGSLDVIRRHFHRLVCNFANGMSPVLREINFPSWTSPVRIRSAAPIQGVTGHRNPLVASSDHPVATAAVTVPRPPALSPLAPRPAHVRFGMKRWYRGDTPVTHVTSSVGRLGAFSWFRATAPILPS